MGSGGRGLLAVGVSADLTCGRIEGPRRWAGTPRMSLAGDGADGPSARVLTYTGGSQRVRLPMGLPMSRQSPPPNQYHPFQNQFGPSVVTSTARWNSVKRPVPVSKVHLASTTGPGWFQSQTPVVLPFLTVMVA